MTSNNDSTYEKGPLPTITIIDSADKPSSDKLRSCCICFPEQTGVAIIFSFYFLFGFLSSIASLLLLTNSSDTVDKTTFAISFVLYAFLSISGILGLTLIQKDNAVMMRKLSIAFWIITGLTLIYNLSGYIYEVTLKNTFIQQCQDDPANANIDCNQAINFILVRDALKTIFVEFFSLYFSYVISRFSRRMLEDSKKPILPYGVDQNGQTTPSYTVYVNRPPTSLDWIPPPTYTVRANDIPSDTKNASVLS